MTRVVDDYSIVALNDIQKLLGHLFPFLVDFRKVLELTSINKMEKVHDLLVLVYFLANS